MMKTLVKKVKLFLKRNSGQSLSEYAFILAFIALAVIVTLALFGFNLQALYQFIVNQAFPL